MRTAVALLLVFLPGVGAADEPTSPEETRPSPAATGAAAGAVTVPVTFRGTSLYRVLVGRQFCAAPCVLDLPPGPARLLVVGDSVHPHRSSPQFEEEVIIPARPATVLVDLAYHNRKLAGTALLGVGAGCAAVGAITLGIGAIGGWLENGNRPGLASLIGGTFLGLGVVYAIVGGSLMAGREGKRLEIRTDSQAISGVRFAGAGLALSPNGAGAATVAFTF